MGIAKTPAQTLPIGDNDRLRIETAITELERSTSGEVVPMIVGCSDLYTGARWRFALLLSLLGVYLTAVAVQPVGWALTGYLCLQIGLMILGLLLTRIPALLRLVTDEETIQEEVRQAAVQRFFEYGLHLTRERTGILIYVSLAEHRIEILADAGIHAKVGEVFWRQALDAMLPLVRQHKITEALLLAIDLVRTPLTEHFPRSAADTNEIADQLIVH